LLSWHRLGSGHRPIERSAASGAKTSLIIIEAATIGTTHNFRSPI
jgi:hypothetical protein